jgi:filamentous hemagglutinin
VDITKEQAIQEGKILAVNGILNEADRAAQLAYQNAPTDKAGSKPDNITLVHIAPASTGLGELMVAGYEKALASTLGYSNADLDYTATLQGRGDRETLSLGHSRGTIVQTNALNILADRGYTNLNLSVVGVGGAVQSETYIDAAKSVMTAQPKGEATYTYMRNDPIPVIAAGNPGDAWAAFKEFFSVLRTNNSAHSCYGTGASGCVDIANPVLGGPTPTNPTPGNVVTVRWSAAADAANSNKPSESNKEASEGP